MRSVDDLLFLQGLDLRRGNSEQLLEDPLLVLPQRRRAATNAGGRAGELPGRGEDPVLFQKRMILGVSDVKRLGMTAIAKANRPSVSITTARISK